MIDKIDSNYSYNYGKITKHSTTDTGAFEELRKNYEENGVVYEKNEKKEAVKKYEELPKKGMTEENKIEHASGLTFEQIKETVRSVIAFLKETWRMIWEDTPKASEAEDRKEAEREVEVQTLEENATVERIAPSETEVKQVLKSHNLEALNAMLTNNGRIKPARNSNLLTTYDKRGRIVSIESSDRERILHGDKNFIKQ